MVTLLYSMLRGNLVNPLTPAAAISAAAAAAAVTPMPPMPASPGLRKGTGYEARVAGEHYFPCEITGKQTDVVSYTVKFDSNGETRKVEAGAKRANGALQKQEAQSRAH
jgi:hypothetical protein